MQTKKLPRVSSRKIAIAQELDIYDCTEIEEKLKDLEPEQVDLRNLYKKMLKSGSGRMLVMPSRLPNMQKLVYELPNFAEPLKDIERQLSLCLGGGDTLEISPLLLLGPPGVGKTHFANRLADILETDSVFISMGTTTAGWVLAGSSSGWRGSRPGKILSTLLDNFFANPVVVIDEIDKAAAQAQYDPMGGLYSLLERSTARKFIDEFADTGVDASHITWVTTANDIHSIPKLILDRLNVHEISPPNKEQARRIAFILYKEIRDDHNWGKDFEENPSDEVLDYFSKHTPRHMREMWMTGFGNAKLAKRSSVQIKDIQLKRKLGTKMGF